MEDLDGPDERRQLALAHLETGPQLEPYSLFAWSAFIDLGTERPASLAGVRQIPHSKIVAYASFYDLNQAEADHLIRVIRTVDEWYVAEAIRRQDQQSAK